MRRWLGILAVIGVAAASAPMTAQDTPIIDRELFFGDPEIAGGQISPNGEFISFIRPHRDVMNVWVKRISDPFDAAWPVTADTTRPVTGYFWTRDSGNILFVQDQGGNENFHVYAVDPRGAADPATGVPVPRDLTPYENIRAQILAVPKGTPNQMVVGLNDRDPQVHDVYRLDIRTGDRQLVIENTQGFAGWLTDLRGDVRLGLRLGADGGTEILRVDDGDFSELYSCSNEETCAPIRFHRDGRRVYMTSDKGEDVNLGRLILVDAQTGTEELVESDPEGQADFGGAAFSDVTDELIATFYVGDRVRIYPKTAQLEQELELLRSKLPEGEISFGSSTSDEQMQLVRVARDVDPGSAYLYDRRTGDVELLYRSRPDLPSEHLASQQAVRYPARDGFEIPAYLTLPKGIEPRNLPTVILPHGGPWARDIWGYDPYAQYLANRGYAVLQPNFRGSTGYGKEFLNAGNGEWGTGDMQHDISDGVKYLVDQGIADPDRVGIFGGSYGGYATLAGLAFTPDLYAAGVSYVGPSNILTLLKTIPPYWAPIKKIFDVRVGNPDVPEDRERLIRQSPLFSAENITAPLLVVQGANDPRVNQRESEQIVVALRDLGRSVEYMLAEDEGHGFAGRENRLALAVGLEQFFGKQLGGRYQRDIPEDLAATMEKLTVDVNTVEVADLSAAAEDAATAPLPVTDGESIDERTLEYNSTIHVMGQDVRMAVTRQIEEATRDGQALWRVVDQAESPMGGIIDTLEVDRATLQPVRRAVAGAASINLEFTDDAVTGEIRAMGQQMPVQVDLQAPVFADGSGFELALAGLPLEEGYVTGARVLDAQQQRVRPVQVEVTGRETVTTTQGDEYDTFVVQVTPLDGDESGGGTYNVMAVGPHYLVKSTVRLPATMGSGTVDTELGSTYERN